MTDNPSHEIPTSGVGPWRGEWPAGEQYDLELLRTPDVYIEAGWADFTTKVRDAVRTGKVREGALRSAVVTEHNAAVRANFERLESTTLVSAA